MAGSLGVKRRKCWLRSRAVKGKGLKRTPLDREKRGDLKEGKEKLAHYLRDKTEGRPSGSKFGWTAALRSN